MFSLSDRIKEVNTLLHPLAIPHDGRMGRRHEELQDELRTPFQRDRDRIIHSTAFRRLQGKTQVFVTGEGDHFRTRLTHTLEVAQIARDIARVLAMNEDATECIALAHDIGHPPFGHRGEHALEEWMQQHGLHFEHNLQAFRIVTMIETHSSQYAGLNLNHEIEDGLLKHSTHHPIDERLLETPLEAHIANIADEIAYTSHDTDDGLTAKLFSFEELMDIPLAQEAHERLKERGTAIRGSLIHLLVSDLIKTSYTSLQADSTKASISFSASMRAQLNKLRSFLAQHMYLHPRVSDRAAEGQKIIHLLCDYYLKHPSEKILAIGKRTNGTLPEAVKDYVAGMTDSFAWSQAAEEGLLDEFIS